MPIPSIHGATVTRLRGDKVDDGYGGEAIDWSTPAELKIDGCGMAPLAGEELTDRGRQGVEDAWTLYAPYGADITAKDRIVSPWGTFEVDGAPSPWVSPLSGRRHGLTVTLRWIDG